MQSNNQGWFGLANNPGDTLHGGHSGGGVFHDGKYVGALSGVYPGWTSIQRLDGSPPH